MDLAGVCLFLSNDWARGPGKSSMKHLSTGYRPTSPSLYRELHWLRRGEGKTDQRLGKDFLAESACQGWVG